MASNEELTLVGKFIFRMAKEISCQFIVTNYCCPRTLVDYYQGCFLFPTFEDKQGEISLKELNINDL